MEDLKKKVDSKMKKSFDSLLHNFQKIRTGVANTGLLDDIKINYYGAPTPIKQLCNVTIPEPRMIIVQPWDKTAMGDIDKSILAANLGITPVNDGNVIRLPFQGLTEDKRKDIVKDIKKLSEESKINIRNIRREGNDSAKKMKKDSVITEDDEKKVLQEIQNLTDNWIDKISEVAKTKEKEIMEV